MDRFHYTECGLDNVVIEGEDLVHEVGGETTYSLRNIDGLHRAIAQSIITSEGGMNGKELRFLRTEIGLTQAQLAERLRKDGQTIGRWERGEIDVDQTAEIVIRALAAEILCLDAGGVQTIWQRVTPAADGAQIVIDGSDPNHYRPLAA